MSKSLYTTIIEETAPTTTTVGVVGQLYLDSTTKILYQCVAINIEDLTYEWKQIGGGVSQEDFNKLVNNEIQIKDAKNNFVAGGTSNVWGEYQVAIGSGVNVGTGGGNYGVAIGYKAMARNYWTIGIGAEAAGRGNMGIAIGYKAAIASDGVSYAIQLGPGTNGTDKTLQILDDNIYNASTHTLTVQNIELNGTDLNTTINEVTSKAMKALVTPVSAPSKIELVAVDSTNAQTMIEIGDGIVLENGSLKVDFGTHKIMKLKPLFERTAYLSESNTSIVMSEALTEGKQYVLKLQMATALSDIEYKSFNAKSVGRTTLMSLSGSLVGVETLALQLWTNSTTMNFTQTSLIARDGTANQTYAYATILGLYELVVD